MFANFHGVATSLTSSYQQDISEHKVGRGVQKYSLVYSISNTDKIGISNFKSTDNSKM